MLYFVTSAVYVRVMYCKASCYLGFQLHKDGALVRWVRHFDKVDASVTLQQVLCHAALFTVTHTQIQLLIFLNYSSIKRLSFSNADTQQGYIVTCLQMCECLRRVHLSCHVLYLQKY
jgi:hypothetical protein